MRLQWSEPLPALEVIEVSFTLSDLTSRIFDHLWCSVLQWGRSRVGRSRSKQTVIFSPSVTLFLKEKRLEGSECCSYQLNAEVLCVAA